MFKSLSVVGAFVLAAGQAFLGSQAFAADLPSRKAPPTYIPPIAAFSWTGFYLGAEGGIDFTRTSGPFTDSFGNNSTPYVINGTHGLIGGLGGFNYQINSFVVGIEGNIDAIVGSGKLVNVPGPFTVSSTNTFGGDVRGRVGFAIDRALLFVSGGLAFGDVKNTYAVPQYNFNTTRVGYTFGGGVDYAFTNSIVGRLEYRRVDLGAKSFTVAPPIDDGDRASFRSSEILVGLIFKFPSPPPAAIVAKY